MPQSQKNAVDVMHGKNHTWYVISYNPEGKLKNQNGGTADGKTVYIILCQAPGRIHVKPMRVLLYVVYATCVQQWRYHSGVR